MVKFTYSTEEETIFKLKNCALEYGVNARDILDIAFENLLDLDSCNDGYIYNLLMKKYGEGLKNER